MSEDNTWPDPARPGVPLNPERDGWHWLKTGRDGLTPWFWVEDQGNEGCFGWETEDDIYSAENMAFGETSYLGPCLAPAEVDARIAQARRDALEEAAQMASNRAAAWTEDAIGKFLETKWDYESRAEAGEEIASAILARAALGEK